MGREDWEKRRDNGGQTDGDRLLERVAPESLVAEEDEDAAPEPHHSWPYDLPISFLAVSKSGGWLRDGTKRQGMGGADGQHGGGRRADRSMGAFADEWATSDRRQTSARAVRAVTTQVWRKPEGFGTGFLSLIFLRTLATMQLAW